MLEIALCDDDIQLTGYLEEKIHILGMMCNVKLEIEVYKDGREILADVVGGRRFDIIFMDIVMEEINGLKAAEKIRKLDQTARLIYMTSHCSYMGDTFHTSPIGFLQKPIELEQLEKVFFLVLKMVCEYDVYYRFRYSKCDYKVAIKRILYCESHRRETQIITTEKRYPVFKRLSLVAKELSQRKCSFVRIHESYLVNYCHVSRFSYDSVELSNGAELPVSRKYTKEVADLFRWVWED